MTYTPWIYMKPGANSCNFPPPAYCHTSYAPVCHESMIIHGVVQNRFPSIEQECISQESDRSFESSLYLYNGYYLVSIDVLNNIYNTKCIWNSYHYVILKCRCKLNYFYVNVMGPLIPQWKPSQWYFPQSGSVWRWCSRHAFFDVSSIRTVNSETYESEMFFSSMSCHTSYQKLTTFRFVHMVWTQFAWCIAIAENDFIIEN